MSTLFTFSRSWHQSASLFEQLGFAQKGDAILLIEDAVLALQSPITLASFVAKCHRAGVDVFALNDDLMLRGVENQYPEIALVNYPGFVELVANHSKHVAW